MKKVFMLVAFIAAIVAGLYAEAASASAKPVRVRAARRAAMARDAAPNEVVSVTTNDAGQVSRVVTVSGTNILWFVDKDFKVPFKYRKIWNSMNEEEREQFKTKITLEDSTPVLVAPAAPVYPKKPDGQTDTNVPEETKMIRVRF